MKRLIVLILAAVIASVLLFSAADPYSQLLFGEELSFSEYNCVGSLSSTSSPYSVQSLTMNTKVSNEYGVVFSDVFGLCAEYSLGYQKDLYPFNRFVSIPKNINGTLTAGCKVIPIDGLGISLMGGLRSSYLLNKSKWISQVGGIASIGYSYGPFYFALSGGYWYNTNYRSIVGGVSAGLSF